MPPRSIVKSPIAIGIAIAALLMVAGPFVYLRIVRGPADAPLTLPTATPTAPQAGGPFEAEGTWSVTTGSQVGYRVAEILFGQSGEAVGRTAEVRGSATIEGSAVTAATFTVDVASIASDQDRRDNQFRGRIMETSRYPTATFTLTQPIDFGSVPAAGTKVTERARGDLTLKGTTRSVAFTISATRDASTISASGSIPITFADYGIANPSFGPAQTGDEGTLEFLLVFAKS